MPKYLVSLLAYGVNEPPFEIEDVELEDVIVELLKDWAAGHIVLHGVMNFLRANGVEPPLEDEVVSWEKHEQEIVDAAEAVREIIERSASIQKQLEFVEAVSRGIRLSKLS